MPLIFLQAYDGHHALVRKSITSWSSLYSDVRVLRHVDSSLTNHNTIKVMK